MTWMLLLLLTAAPAFASDEDVRKGLQNLQTIHELAQLVEGALLTGVAPAADLMPKDPWGTHYAVLVDKPSYRIVSAGSDRDFDYDRRFDKDEQFTGLEKDVVMVDGRIVRSNRNWLAAQVTDATRAALDALVRAEVHLMMSRNPTMQDLERRRATVNLIQEKGSALEADAWGTPVRVIREGEKVRIVSAGADKTFDEASWSKPPTADVGEDIVVDDLIPQRVIDDQAVLKAAKPKAEPIPQPLDPPLDFEWPKVADGIKGPVVLNRVEPKYPDIYRRAGISGIVIVEVAISEKGEVEGTRVLKSLAPGIDGAALEALRQWTYEPATKDGEPVAVLFNQIFNFSPD
jgi:TonB family protein